MDLTFLMQSLALALGFYMAWNIGANDVANAMGTSVGSKALTIRKAIWIAAILEFSGAYFFGSNVTSTIQKGILSTEFFASDATTFVLGMLAVLFSTGLLLQVASYFAMPVSTTHAVVGSVLGFGWLVGGSSAVQWGSVAWICSSWVISPFISGCLAYIVFWLIHSYMFSRFLPYLVAIFLGGLSCLYVSFYLATVIGGGVFCIVTVWIRQKSLLISGTGSLHLKAVETSFIGLQIASACLVAFAHGANDVSNAIGPVAAILSTLGEGAVSTRAFVPSWLLAFGGLSMILGLLMWGSRVIETVGKKITDLSPMKGFAAEFSTASTVLVATKMGLPISTTHALIGAILGVGLVQGFHALNLKIFRNILVSWLVTLPMCGFFSGAIFWLLRLCFQAIGHAG